MIYNIGMLCKHFKGTGLLEKNIYKIENLGVSGLDIDESLITYTGDGILSTATNLVVYSNIFQDNKLFCREYEDISGELTDDKKTMYNQILKVQPLTDKEIAIINSDEYVEKKKEFVTKKYSKKIIK